ncbi:MAG: hypothetical protein H6557_05590 [Lewinellaceae bacterium]|nr:hypothetical protein [Lewinellaceae bacterium]
MKVACIGNMNNMLFSLTRYLREKDIDAHLFLSANELNGLEHFLPQNDTFDNKFENYTKQLSWGAGGSTVFKNTTKEQIKRDLAGFDFFIVCGTAIGYLHKAGIKTDIYFPHGSDIKYVPFMGEKMTILNKFRNFYGFRFFESMKKGIQSAKIINIEHSDPFWKDPLIRLNVLNKSTYFGCPMVFDTIYNRENIAKYYQNITNLELYEKLRVENDLLIVNQASQTWTAPIDKTGRISKGSNNLIEGFASFIAQKPHDYKAKLILFEYGNDVKASKKLISNLGIINHVLWHPTSARKEIMTLLSFADFACGEFYPGCIGGNTTWEALVSGACLLHYLNTKHTEFKEFLDTPYPFVNVKKPEEISKVLLDFTLNQQKYKNLGQQGTIWYKKYFAEKSLNKWIELIEKSKND